ncbi:MAG TPA: hypothetical protein VK760_14810 [Candidatus Acidoferrales bacterium]|nr:hypothetical protein [Candidatus Acidoferrales bacterium]
MSRWFIGFALVVALGAALSGMVVPSSASAQTTPAPSPTASPTMQPR